MVDEVMTHGTSPRERGYDIELDTYLPLESAFRIPFSPFGHCDGMYVRIIGRTGTIQ